MKVSFLKLEIVDALKKQKGLDWTPGNFYLQYADRTLKECQTISEQSIKMFADILIKRCDGENV